VARLTKPIEYEPGKAIFTNIRRALDAAGIRGLRTHRRHSKGRLLGWSDLYHPHRPNYRMANEENEGEIRICEKQKDPPKRVFFI
jgi:hypothetical protein